MPEAPVAYRFGIAAPAVRRRGLGSVGHLQKEEWLTKPAPPGRVRGTEGHLPRPGLHPRLPREVRGPLVHQGDVLPALQNRPEARLPALAGQEAHCETNRREDGRAFLEVERAPSPRAGRPPPKIRSPRNTSQRSLGQHSQTSSRRSLGSRSQSSSLRSGTILVGAKGGVHTA